MFKKCHNAAIQNKFAMRWITCKLCCLDFNAKNTTTRTVSTYIMYDACTSVVIASHIQYWLLIAQISSKCGITWLTSQCSICLCVYAAAPSSCLWSCAEARPAHSSLQCSTRPARNERAWCALTVLHEHATPYVRPPKLTICRLIIRFHWPCFPQLDEVLKVAREHLATE